MDGFAASLERSGYRPATAVRYLRAAADLGHFVHEQGGSLADIDLSVFREHLRTCRCPRSKGGRRNHHTAFGKPSDHLGHQTSDHSNFRISGFAAGWESHMVPTLASFGDGKGGLTQGGLIPPNDQGLQGYIAGNSLPHTRSNPNHRGDGGHLCPGRPTRGRVFSCCAIGPLEIRPPGI